MKNYMKAVQPIVLACIMTSACVSQLQAESTKLEDIGPDAFGAIGEQATGEVCSSCHGWDVIFGGPRQTPRQWDSTISDMLARGAVASDEQLDLVGRFLKWAWGTVWINSATAQDLVAVLALPEKDAAAVIAYREEHGSFADLESLKAVPGVDPATFDSQAGAIMFN